MREGQAKVLTTEELNRVQVMAATGRQAKRDLVLLDFSFLLGLRVKEMAALMIEDVTEDNGQIKESFYLKADQAKGNKGRTVYLTNKKLRKNLNSYLNDRVDSNKHLFKSQKTAFTANTLQQLFKRLYTKAGIKGAKSHSGRRTFATRLIHKGFDIKSVSVLMGHTNIQTTARYIDTNPIQLGNMVANL
ncbi:Tyrosine recombinase XerD [Candidatus Electrothrix aarhusensis]